MSNSGVDHVTRFPASDPSKAENFKTGINNSGLAIDSGGNVWVTNRFGTGLLGMAHLIDMGIHLKLKGVASASDYLTKTMSEQKGGRFGGSVTLLRPDGSQFPGSPFKGDGLPGPWAAVVDGNDNVWISNSILRAAQSCSCVASALKTARPARRPATRFRHPAVTSEEDCRCRPILPSTRLAMSG